MTELGQVVVSHGRVGKLGQVVVSHDRVRTGGSVP